MSQFTEALVVTPLADGKTWVILREFGYDVGEEGSGDHIAVAIGFQTDFATIPRVFWVVLPRWGRYGNASVIHDWLYWTQTRPRKEADDIFLEGMSVLEVGALSKYLIYTSVRLFGFIAWYRNEADRAVGFDRVRKDVPVRATARSRRPGTLRQLLSRAFRR
jgi:hypothetical protein